MSANTLHLFNPENTIDLDSYLKMVNINDAIAIFPFQKKGSKQIELPESLLQFTKNIYFITDKNDYIKLLDLLSKYKKTLTWK